LDSFVSLGPLINPAKPTHVVVGVYTDSLGLIMAEALRLSGVKRAWVVCGAMGLDEVYILYTVQSVCIDWWHFRLLHVDRLTFGILQ
jgi:anthranilate phosphoribosyltransferase